MDKLKVVFVLPATNIGGAETVCINLINSLDYDKYDSTLIVIRQTGDLLEKLNKNTRLIDLNCKSTKSAPIALATYLRKLKPVIVFTTHSRAALLVSLISFVVPKFTQITRMQSSPQAEKNHQVYGSVQRFLYSWAFRRSDIVVAQTEEMKSEGERLFGISYDRLVVASNPVRDEVIRCTMESSKHLTHLMSKGCFNIVAAGRLSPVKGFRTLVTAFGELNDAIPNARLYILGRDGPEGEIIRELVRELGLSDKVKLLGHVKDPTPYFAECDLFVLSSIYEGCPNVFIENFVMNTPIVATQCCGLVSRLITEGINGFTVEIDNPKELAHAIEKAHSKLTRAKIKNKWPSEGSLISFFNDQLTF